MARDWSPPGWVRWCLLLVSGAAAGVQLAWPGTGAAQVSGVVVFALFAVGIKAQKPTE